MFTESPEARSELVIGHSFWQRRFAGDPRVIGRKVTLNSRPLIVVGVAPAEFRGTELWTDMDVWIPMSAWGDPPQRRTRGFTVIGRLRPGATLDGARAELGAIMRNLAAAYPDANKDCGAVLHSARERQISQGGGPAGVLFAAISAVLLLLACANVANVLLARGEARRREMAVRTAIGCSRPRLIRQLLTESGALAALGALAGVLVAAWLIRLVPLLLPPTTFLHYQFRLDHRALAFAAAASAVSLFLFGLAPALRASRPDLAPTLKNETPNRRAPFVSLRDALVAGQIALSLLLLANAGLLIRSFLHCLALDTGFARENVLVAWLYPRMPEPQARAFYRDLSERVRALPGVQRVALARRVPLATSGGGAVIPVSAAPGAESRVKYTIVDPSYFRAMGLRLLAGRDFTERDNAAGERTVIMSETAARRFWPAENPLGKLLVVSGRPRTVVGVAADVKIINLFEAPEPYLYLPFGQEFSWEMTLVVKTLGDPLALAAPLKAQIRALAHVPPPEINTMESLFSFRTTEQRSLAWLVAALGASRCDVLRLVFRRAAALTGIGAALGLAGALALSQSLASLVVGVSPRDPVVLGAVCLLVLAIAALASLNPALRATRVDPLRAIRYE